MYNFGVKFFIFSFSFAFMFSPLVGYSTLALNTIDSYVGQNDEVYLIYEDELEITTDNVSVLPETGSKTPKCLIIKYTYVKGKKVAKVVKIDCPKKKVKVTPTKPTIKKNTPTPKPTKKLTAKKIAYKRGTSYVSACPFVGTDYSSPMEKCSQGPYGNTSHSCKKSGYYAIDLVGDGYGVAPGDGTVRFYPENTKYTWGCTQCAGHCLNTIRLEVGSRTYVYTHMKLYGGLTDGQQVTKGQVIGQTYKVSSNESNWGCSTATHLDFSIIENGSRISNVKSIYQTLCLATLKYDTNGTTTGCRDDNKCK